MKVQIRHGIVRHPYSAGSQGFLVATGSTVTLNAANGQLITTIAHGDSDYSHIEQTTTTNAWKGLPVGSPSWLYIDIDKLTGKRTFGFSTVEPAYGHISPVNPVEGQLWFDSTATHQKVYSSGAWRVVIRLVLAKYNGVSRFIPTGSGSVVDQPFAGSQVGIEDVELLAGKILFQDIDTPLRNTNGEFYTTETGFFFSGGETNSVRLESDSFEVIAGEVLPSHHVVKLTADGKVYLAGYNDINSTIIAVSTASTLTDDPVTIIAQGVITNPDWSWITLHGLQPGDPLWIAETGQFSFVDPHLNDNVTYPTSHPPVARVIDNVSILFQQGLGGKGEKGRPGSSGKVRSIRDEGVEIIADFDSINFVGDGVTASSNGDIATVNIPAATGVDVSENDSLVLAKASDINFVGTHSLSCGPTNPVNVVNDLDGTVTVNVTTVPPCIGPAPVSYQTLASCDGVALPHGSRVLSYDNMTGNVMTCDIDMEHSYIKQPVLKKYSSTQNNVAIPVTTTEIELDTADANGANTFFLDIDGSSADPDLLITSIVGTPPSGNHMEVTVVLRGQDTGDTRKIVFADNGSFIWPAAELNKSFQGNTPNGNTAPALIAIIKLHWLGYTIAGKPTWYACAMCEDLSFAVPIPPPPFPPGFFFMPSDATTNEYEASCNAGVSWSPYPFTEQASFSPLEYYDGGISFNADGVVITGSQSGSILRVSSPGNHAFTPPTHLLDDQDIRQSFYFNGVFLVVGAVTGAVTYSTDEGLTWTDTFISGGHNFDFEWIMEVNGFLFAMGDNGYMYRSSDAISWTNVNAGTSEDIIPETLIYDGSEYKVFVKPSFSGTISNVLVSSDGLTFTSTPMSQPLDQEGFRITEGGGRYYLANYIDGPAWSTDYINWTFGTGMELENDARSPIYGNGIVLAGTHSDGHIYRSTDLGQTYTQVFTGSGFHRDILYFDELNRWFALSYNELLYSDDDGLTWQSAGNTVYTGGNYYDVRTIGGEYFLPITTTLYHSTDLTSWTLLLDHPDRLFENLAWIPTPAPVNCPLPPA